MIKNEWKIKTRESDKGIQKFGITYRPLNVFCHRTIISTFIQISLLIFQKVYILIIKSLTRQGKEPLDISFISDKFFSFFRGGVRFTGIFYAGTATQQRLFENLNGNCSSTSAPATPLLKHSNIHWIKANIMANSLTAVFQEMTITASFWSFSTTLSS